MHSPAPPDRPARDRLAAAVRGFLAGDLWAFAFDEAIWEIRGGSADQTVQAVGDRLWHHYDDCTDHPAALCREEWDYFQRLLLILESDAHLTETNVRRWSATQAVAAFGLILTILCGWGTFVESGFEWPLLAAFVPGFVLSAAVHLVNREARRRGAAAGPPDPLYGVVAPFASVAELAEVHRAAAFRKRRFPPEVGERRIRARASEGLLWVQTAWGWFVGTPLVLLWQCLPATDTTASVRLPGDAPSGRG